MLLFQGISLPGAGEGIRYYLTPQWHKLVNTKVRKSPSPPETRRAYLFPVLYFISFTGFYIGMDRRRVPGVFLAGTGVRYPSSLVQLQQVQQQLLLGRHIDQFYKLPH